MDRQVLMKVGNGYILMDETSLSEGMGRSCYPDHNNTFAFETLGSLLKHLSDTLKFDNERSEDR